MCVCDLFQLNVWPVSIAVAQTRGSASPAPLAGTVQRTWKTAHRVEMQPTGGRMAKAKHHKMNVNVGQLMAVSSASVVGLSG